mgnify:CR=1 FL=1
MKRFHFLIFVVVLVVIFTAYQQSFFKLRKQSSVAAVDKKIVYDYEKLSKNEKNIIDQYTEKHQAMYQYLLESSNKNIIEAKSKIRIKYYDNDTVALIVPSDKVGFYLDVYNMQTLEKKSTVPMTLFGNSLEVKNYTIVINDAVIIYYKNGADDIMIIPNSELNSKIETYVKLGDFVSIYDFSFNEETKKLTASVFKPVFSEGKENPKIRTATSVRE